MLKKTPALACISWSLSSLHSTPGKLWDFCLQTASILAHIKVADKGFHNTSTPPQAPKLFKGTLFKQEVQYIFGKWWNNFPQEAKKKIPQVQKGFWENKQNSFPARTEKGSDIQALHPWERSLLCRAHETWELAVEKKGNKFLWPDVELSIVFGVGGPTKCFVWYCPRCQWEFPHLFFLLHTLKNRCDPKKLGAKTIIFYIHRNTCYLKTTAVTPLVDGKSFWNNNAFFKIGGGVILYFIHLVWW